MLAVMDVIPEEQPTPRWVALYEFGLLLRTASGRVHPLGGLPRLAPRRRLRAAKRHRLAAQVQAVLLVARKPTDG
jgi:hypothetical protein